MSGAASVEFIAQQAVSSMHTRVALSQRAMRYACVIGATSNAGCIAMPAAVASADAIDAMQDLDGRNDRPS